MNIFVLIKNGAVIEISDVESSDKDYKKVTAENRDEFEEKLKDQFNITDLEKFEEELTEIFSSDAKDIEVNQYKIVHRVVNRSFGELVDMFQNQEIIIPEMQRNFIWDSQKASRLIESIVLGLPIPPLFFMEISDNRYEVIDGVQRLSTLVNYIGGKPWNGGEKGGAAKLSKKVATEIRGKAFNDLPSEFKRKIKRSTVPLIEFSQSKPGNHDSKYLIFERINTGAEKLNAMQIRKSLAHGKFITSLYEACDNIEYFSKIFSQDALRKDRHVEAFLRVFVMSKVARGEYEPKVQGVKEILNAYCEEHREEMIPVTFTEKFNEYLKIMIDDIFERNGIFKRYTEKDSLYQPVGNMNISIMETVMGTLIHEEVVPKNEQFLKKYKTMFLKYRDSTVKNPFTTSTGTIQSIISRFNEMEIILGVKK